MFLPSSAPEVFDDGLRVDLLLNVDGYCWDFEGLLVLLVFPFPNELGVKGRIPGIENLLRALLVLLDETPQFLRRDVHPLLLLVLQRVDRSRGVVLLLCG